MKRIYKIGTVILVVVCLLTFLAVPVSADSSTNSFTMPLSQPACGETYGYIELLFETPNGEYYPVVYQWVLNLVVTGDESSNVPPDYPDVITNLYSNYMSFDVRSDMTLEHDFYVMLCSTSYDGTYKSYHLYDLYDRVYFNYDLVGFHCYGNNFVYLQGIDSSTLNNNFSFNYLAPLDSISDNTGFIANEISNLSSFFLDGDFYDYMLEVKGTLSNTYDLFNDFFNELSATDLKSYLDYISEINDSVTNLNSLFDGFFYELSATDLNDYLTTMTLYLYDLHNDSVNILNLLDADINDILNRTYNLLDSDIYDVLSDILYSQNNLVNGWEPTNPDGESKFPDTTNPDNNNTPELNGAISDLDDIESEIKGGKTPEDYREEVGDILDKDKNNSVVEESTGVEPEEIEPEDITIVNQNVFNVVFQAFGGKFMTYFIMCLTLAFAAFVLGKRF